ncbi:esterase family protein [Pseudoalteromonas sp. ACER1]|uniref:alpha/beta hydrolase n=1 Tax=unclassified Pseudoalteromonas TaxID=194690 RepID=UPI001F1749E6|nr:MULTISPECIES: alpha/beta hydrolase family protein [unclassified Pseudoalteromonas]MCF2846874.1 esterase family protein [Pseudoalteromonas sp. PAST1]MCO7210364.1 esterase family protein [Pseudoalteromonas sp. ACER1]
MKKLLCTLSLVFSLPLFAYQTDTHIFKGKKTSIEKPVTVTLPDGYQDSKKYNVIYVLHGYSGNHSDWTKLTNIEKLADQYDVIIVNPDGNFGSWYLDSDIDKSSQYETYIADDLLNYIDSEYSTNRSKSGRAITGLSMGGFGALHIAINHPEQFAAVSGISAGVDVRPFSAEFDLEKVLGSYAENKEKWDSIAIINNLHKIAAGNTAWKKGADTLPIMLDIGVDDFFIEQNRALHQAMLKMRIRHDYVERPGIHDWHYWNKVIAYQFLFLTSHMAP